MTNLKEKKNVIFDLGNVVVDIDLNITFQRFEKLGFVIDDNFLKKYHEIRIFKDFEEGRATPFEFTSELLKKMKSGVTHEDVVDAWNSLLGDYNAERISAILDLRQSHKVFLLSNTNSLHIDSCANRVPIVGTLDKLFDKVYYSHEMGMSKPNHIIFETVLSDANIKAEETLYLDDSSANVEAARNLGIESWLVEYPDQWVPMLNQLLK